MNILKKLPTNEVVGGLLLLIAAVFTMLIENSTFKNLYDAFIALFYTTDLSWFSLMVAMVSLFILFLFNRNRVLALMPYLLIGIVLWVAVLKSGVHATLAGFWWRFLFPIDKKQEKLKPN
jgi:Na+/H+ antiporter NhaA